MSRKNLYHRRLKRFALLPLMWELRHLEITCWHKRRWGQQGAGILETYFIAESGQIFFLLLQAGTVADFISQSGR